MPLLGVTECYGDLTQGPTQKIQLMVKYSLSHLQRQEMFKDNGVNITEITMK